MSALIYLYRNNGNNQSQNELKEPMRSYRFCLYFFRNSGLTYYKGFRMSSRVFCGQKILLNYSNLEWCVIILLNICNNKKKYYFKDFV